MKNSTPLNNLVRETPEPIQVPKVTIAEDGEKVLDREQQLREYEKLKVQNSKDTETLLKASILLREKDKEIEWLSVQLASVMEQRDKYSDTIEEMRTQQFNDSILIDEQKKQMKGKDDMIQSLANCLGKMLDQHEADFETLVDGKVQMDYKSEKFAYEYVHSADLCRKLGRKNDCINAVEIWLENNQK